MAQRVTLAIPSATNPAVDVNIGTAENPLVISGGGGSSSSPGIVGGEYNTTLPTLTNGQTDAIQLGSRGSVNVTLFPVDSATAVQFAASSDALNAGTVGMFVRSGNMDFNGTTWDRSKKPNLTSRIVSSAATTNVTVAKASAGDLFRVSGYNSNAAARYLKIYNKATAPTVGTDVPIWTEYLAPQAKFDLSFPKGMYFSLGIGYALVTGVADTDATAVTAADILALNLAYA